MYVPLLKTGEEVGSEVILLQGQRLQNTKESVVRRSEGCHQFGEPFYADFRLLISFLPFQPYHAFSFPTILSRSSLVATVSFPALITFLCPYRTISYYCLRLATCLALLMGCYSFS